MIYYRSEEDSNERVAMYNYDYNRTYMAGGYINYNFTPTYTLAKQKITIYDDGFSVPLPSPDSYNTVQIYNCDWIAFE